VTKEKIYVSLNEIFCDVFDDNSIVITDDTSAEDVEGWDSLEHVNLIVAIEQFYKIKMTVEEITGIRNVGEMVNIILEKVDK